MTIMARRTLSDCKLALQMLEEEEDLARWRVHWVAALTLCRLVGHVLDKVDPRDAEEKRLVNEAYGVWKSDDLEHEIFREFIENHRNALLKEYDFKQHPMAAVPVEVETRLVHPVTGEARKLREIFEIDDNIYRPLLDSYREGDDARDVLREAVEWWEFRLDEIEETLQKYRKGLQA